MCDKRAVGFRLGMLTLVLGLILPLTTSCQTNAKSESDKTLQPAMIQVWDI
ncbi:MAG: hypothetical protein LBP35_01200 [Candidatus Ancillula trichonymphae]|jgi:hypothetical protein|nr:hypothetical protein [Candidatus Ancillula trichonymphae]